MCSEIFKNEKEYFTKETETKKKKKKQIPEQNHSINKMKNALEDTGNRADHMRKRISELDGRQLETLQVEEQRKIRHLKNKNILQELCNFGGKGNISVMGIIKEKTGRREQRLFKEMTAENFSNLEKELPYKPMKLREYLITSTQKTFPKIQY